MVSTPSSSSTFCLETGTIKRPTFHFLLVQLHNYLTDFTAILQVGTKTDRAQSVETADVYPVHAACGVW
jgi:thiaminase